MTTLRDGKVAKFNRRRFLTGSSAMGAASLLGFPPIARAEPPPEISKITLVKAIAICIAPQYLAADLLRLEGFSEVNYVEQPSGLLSDMVENGRADMTMDASTALIYAMDSRKWSVTLAGIHAGCYELFGNANVNAVRDLKGKTVGVYAIGGGDHVLVSSILAYAGLDPKTDVKWFAGETGNDAMRLFIDGKIDAFVGFAPQPQELRAKRVGKVIVNTAVDRPWSQYYCCMLAANRNFVAKYPVATKRAVRAYLKATDICAHEPQRVARYLAERGFEPRYNIGLEVLTSVPFNRWRESDPEDTLRFHALRLHEVGMLKTSPQKLIAQGTDWRFLNQLKKELKA